MVSDAEKFDFIRRYCPAFTFHPHEQYFPCSIEHLLQGSLLKKRPRGSQDNLETVKTTPIPDDLADYVDGQFDYYIEVAPSQLHGCIPAGLTLDAPVYVALVEVEDSYIDIYYISLYAFQGSAMFRCCPKIGKKNNVIAHEFGRHQGDIEHCIVRTDLAFTRVLSVGYEAHDKIAWFFSGEYPEDNGHPLVYASMLNHGCYFFDAPTPIPKGGTGDATSQSQQQWAKTSQLSGVVEAIDLIERSPNSVIWQPHLSDHNIVLVSADNPATKWVRYAGYLGAPLPPPKFTQATEVWGAPLGHFSKIYTEIIAKMAEKLHKTQHSNPTQGLGARHYIQRPFVSSWKHVQVLSEPHLVLSVNPDDVGGPLILAPVRDGDPHQLWHQDSWRQYGNCKTTDTLGIKDTDHVNKDACVLISKATKQLLSCGSSDQLLHCVDYARGNDGDAVRRGVVLDTKALESQPTVEDKYYAVRPVCDTGSSWTAVGNNVSVSGWSSAPHQTWKIVGCRSAEDVMRPREVVNAPDALHSVNNSQLPEGQKLMSRNQAHALVMQGDGNLVYYNGGGAPWASDTGGRGSGPYCLVMQGDNNAVIYGQGGVPIWGSNTNGRGVGPAQLVMQDDGNIVIYDAKGKVLWARK